MYLKLTTLFKIVLFYTLLLFLLMPFLVEIKLFLFDYFTKTNSITPNIMDEGLFDESSRICSVLYILFRSLIVATVSLILSFYFSFIIKRYFSAKQIKLILILITIPFLVSEITRSYSWSLLLGGDGPIIKAIIFLKILSIPTGLFANNEITVYCVMVLGCIPIACFIQLIGLNSIKDNIWLASQDLGASIHFELFRVAIPLSKKSIFISWTITFLLSLSMSTVVDFLGGSSKESLKIITSSLFGASKIHAVLCLATWINILTIIIAYIYWIIFGKHQINNVREYE